MIGDAYLSCGEIFTWQLPSVPEVFRMGSGLFLADRELLRTFISSIVTLSSAVVHTAMCTLNFLTFHIELGMPVWGHLVTLLSNMLAHPVGDVGER
jgi:hypothetical protein